MKNLQEALPLKEKPIQSIEALEAFVPFTETVQFSDGQTGLLYRAEGSVVNWGIHKYTRNLDSRHSNDCAIIAMSTGRRFAFGRGMSILLPELDSNTGKFYDQKTTTAARLNDIAPQGLPDLKVGMSWAPLDNQGSVDSVMIRYKQASPAISGYTQIDMPNYFDDAEQLLVRADAEMSASSSAGPLAVHQTRQQ